MQIHVDVRTHIYQQIHVGPMYAYVQAGTCMHTYIHADTCRCTDTYIPADTCMYAYVQAGRPTCLHISDNF